MTCFNYILGYGVHLKAEQYSGCFISILINFLKAFPQGQLCGFI